MRFPDNIPPSGRPVLLAVSGGVDSMAMAQLYLNTATLRQLPPCAVAHCNFHLRGEESDGDMLFVRRWAEERGVEIFVKDFDTASYAGERRLSIEMAARELRYRWFDQLCASGGFSGVCVAHNADDNAETLLLNLLRGTGLRGLCAMDCIARNPFGSSAVFRPLLRYSRAEIEKYAISHGIGWRTDSTNADSGYRRNFLRNEVFPLLKKINPSAVDTLDRDIAVFREAMPVVEDYCRQTLAHADISVDVPRARQAISISVLTSYPHWGYPLFSFLDSFGFSRSVYESLSSLLRSGGPFSGRRFFSGGYVLVTGSDSISVYADSCGGDAQGGAAWSEVSIERLPWNPSSDPRTSRGVILMDADKFDGEPVLRLWKEGDWLKPIGLRGKKKVSDMLTDLKCNLVEKSRTLVVEGEGNHVLAVVGERIDESVKVTPSTTAVYRISRL